MNKLLSIISILTFSIILIGNVNSYEADINKLTKEVILTTAKVTSDFGDEYTKAIDMYFINIRYFKDKDSLNKIEEVLKPIIKDYNNKIQLTNDENKSFNLFKNIYIRSKLLRNYIN